MSNKLLKSKFPRAHREVFNCIVCPTNSPVPKRPTIYCQKYSNAGGIKYLNFLLKMTEYI